LEKEQLISHHRQQNAITSCRGYYVDDSY